MAKFKKHMMYSKSGEGKMAKGTEFYAWYRVEPFEENAGGDPSAGSATDFEPQKLEA